MKKSIIYTLLIIYSCFVSGCKDQTGTDNYDFKYITAVKVIYPEAISVKIDNFAHFISIDFPAHTTDLTKVKIKLSLAKGVDMKEPKDFLAEYDLTKNNTISLQKGGTKVSFQIKFNLISDPLNPLSKGWEKVSDFGELPEYISIYKYTKKVNGKNVEAYIGVADMNNKAAHFTVLGEEKGTQRPTQFYQTSNRPKLLLNAGYFWNGHSLGLIVRDGKTIKIAQPMAWRNYNGASTVYYPTQGVFGLISENIFQTHWAYHSEGKLYIYSSPAQNKAGEKPLPIPSDKFPEEAKVWKPVVAIGAGPVLINSGEYKNFWMAEMFDDTSGIGPLINNPRSAIAYAPNGELVFFVCEGRNKTPNVPGLTLKDVADLLLDLGCTEALNLDGGGSSCMLVNGKETIKPSDGKQRAITSMVAIY